MNSTVSNKILVAGLLGFAAGILYAPRKGTETQAKLKAHMQEMKSGMEDKAQRAKSKLEDMKKSKEEKELDKVDRKISEAADSLLP